MRTAHVVGLSPDGRSLVVTTDTGEELALAADDRLREALRGIGARHGRLETPMDSSLSPRDIQARIRAGASLDEVTEAAGMPLERVERFAAPVLAEREHVAATAVASLVRRRGETSGHRNLRTTAADRLLKRGVDVDTVAWDAHRLDDGRWAVTADYTLGDEAQRATFFFDLRGRYSVAADDPARWLIGEQPPGTPATGGRRGGPAADEPTVDLTDELALVRVVQEPAPEQPVTEVTEIEHEQTERTVVRALRSVPAAPAVPEPVEQVPEPDEPEPLELEQPEDDQPSGGGGEEPATGGDDHERQVPGVEEPSELTALYAMLGSDGYSEDSPRVYAGLSDAAAVPDTSGGGWEPAIEVNYPVEPSPEEEAALPPAEHPDRPRVPMDDKSSVELSTPVDVGPRPVGQPHGTDEPAAPYARTDEADRAEEAAEFVRAEEAAAAAQRRAAAPVESGTGGEDTPVGEDTGEFQLESEPAPPKPVKRKRASVPSWDEIMFGGPKPPS